MRNEETLNDILVQITEASKKQRSQNRSDEIKVQRAMLNDPTFKIGIYDKKEGLIGERCPREEAVQFITDISSSITGLDRPTTEKLAENYEFTKKDAQFFINMNKDFISTYLRTGRKLGLIQTEDCEASVLYRSTASREKIIPGKDGIKTTVVPSYTKLISKSKAPKYLIDETNK